MVIEKMQMHTNARIVATVLTKYRDTFYALKELINNSLYAKATRIDINFLPSECDMDSVCYHPIDKIQIIDNGYGVSHSDFKKSIMVIATDNKSDGHGVGRFSALQIGRCMHISTTAYDVTSKQYSKTEVDFDIRQFQKDDLQNKEFTVKTSLLEGSHTTGYQVEISDLYTYDEKCKRKNRLGKEYTNEGFPQKLFESYPIYIFEGKVKFYFNGIELKRTDFTTGEPSIKKTFYTDIQGRTHEVIFKYYSLKLKEPKVRLFLQCFDGNINYTALELTYNSNWYAPSLGTQFVLIESDYLTRDFCDNYELVNLNNKEWGSFSTFLKKEIDEHYKKDNVKYKRFLQKLQNDKSYPFTITEIGNNSLSVDLFNQSAFIIEDDLKILETGDNNKRLIYTLLRKVIDDGNISFIIEHVMGLSVDSKAKLIELLDKTNLEAIVNYTSSLAKMEQALEMLNKITVCEVDKHTEQFADISFLLSRNMWLFGEQYMGAIAIEPEEDICRVLDKLFRTYISYKPQPKKYDNQIEECKRKVKSLSSMAFYSERRLAANEKDILCVVMLAPSIKANQYDLAQIDNYIYQLEKDNTIVKEGVRFRIYFVVSMLADFAKSQMASSSTNDNEPFLYKCRNQNGNDIKAFLLEWKQLVKNNKELLAYASSSLKLNKFDVEAAFMQEYSDLIEKKNTAQLHIVK
ncbi:ATP-binding protein [Prevotella sp.]|uniref:ATP-binding protein n=1 Tax=Prevotella sp. TaxID=59823 RepID=UPI003FEDA26E